MPGERWGVCQPFGLGLIKQPEGSSGEQTLARSIAAHGIWTVLNVESWLRQWV